MATIDKATAIKSLQANAEFVIRGDEIEWLSSDITQPTDEEISAEQTRLQYTEDRVYPSIEEQLDMQYWDAVNGTTTWKDAIAQVKADNPKPE